MKNLKKVLALGLSAAMALSMFVTGAGAAFTDQADIKAAEAVDTLATLGIINGNPDGSFKPEGTVTRAEMAKMIFVVRNGGKDDATSFAANQSTFTDINGHWAAGYIKYCQSLGIIAGKSATQFAPEENVTGEEAAKMLLVTLGYDAEKAGLIGTSWAQKTTALAAENGLLDDMDTPMSTALPRQYAAQVIFNAVNADTVILKDGEYQKKEITTSGLIPYTKDVEVYQITVNTTEVDGSGAAAGVIAAVKALNGTTYSSISDAKLAVEAVVGTTDAAKIVMGSEYTVAKTTVEKTEYTYGQVTKNETLGKKYLSLETSEMILNTVKKETNKDTFNLNGGVFTKVEADYSNLIGQQVKVLYKDRDEVYGVYATTKNTVYTGIADDIDTVSGNTKKVKFDGTEYKLAKAITAVPAVSINTSTETTLDALRGDAFAPFAVSLIDNDDDGEIELAVYTPVTVAKVTYVGNDSITLQNVGSKDRDDINVYDGIAKNDWAVIVDADNTVDDKDSITKATVITGKVTGTKSDSKKGLIDGTWYTGMNGTTFNSGDTVDVVAVGNFAYNVEISSSTATDKDIVYVSKAAQGTGLNNDLVEAVLYFTDGTSKNAYVSKVGSTDIVSGNAVAQANAIKNKMFTYTMDGSDYELKLVDSSNKAGYAGLVSGATYAKQKLSNGLIADEAVMFVQAGTDVKVLSGKQVKAWADAVTPSFAGDYLYTNNNGYKYAKIGFLYAASGEVPDASGDGTYGYLTADPYTGIEDNTNYTYLTIWNGTTTMENVKVKTSNVKSSISKGSFISYEEGDGTVLGKVEALTSVGAITAYDDNKNITIVKADGSIDDKATEVTKDTKVIYVNTKDKKGVEGGSIQTAQQNQDGSYALNAVYKIVNTDDLDVLFVDVNTGKLENVHSGNAGVAMGALTNTASIDTFALEDSNITKVVEGDVVKVTFKHNTAGTVTVTKGAGLSGPTSVSLDANSAKTVEYTVTDTTADLTLVTASFA